MNPVIVDFSDANVGVLFNGEGIVDQIFMRKVYNFNASDPAINNGIDTDPVTGGELVGTDPITGAIRDRVATFSRLALDSLYLYISEQEEDQTLNPLSLDTNLWVSVSSSTGATNVGYNVPSNTTLAGLRTWFNGTGDVANLVERENFNSAINAARSVANLGSAAQ